MRLILHCTCFALVFLYTALYSNTPDSLYQQYISTLDHERGYVLWNNLAISVRKGHPDSCIRYAQLALDAAEKSKDFPEQVKALTTLGHAERYLGNFQTGLAHSFDALEIKKKYSKDGSYSAFINIAISYKQIGNYDSALTYYEYAFQRALKKNNPHLVGDILNNIGNVYRNKGEYAKALDYHRQCLDIRIQENDTLGISFCYSNLGNIYLDRKNINMALVCCKKTLELRNSLKNNPNMGVPYLNIGIAYQKANANDSALIFMRMAEKEFLKTNTLGFLALTYSHMGNALVQSGNLPEGENYLNKSLEMSKSMGINKGVIDAANYLGHFHLKKDETDKAISFFELAFHKAQETGVKVKIAEGYENLSKVHHLKGDYKKSYELLTQGLEIKDSIPVIEGESIIRDLQTKYTLESKEKEIALLTKDKNIFVLKGMAGLILSLFIIAGCVALLFRNRYRYQADLNHILSSQQTDIEDKNRRLKMSNQELEQYTFAVSHDLKQPLRTIGSFATLLEKRFAESLGQEGKDFIQYITRGVGQMENLLTGMLNYSQIGDHVYSREDINLNELIAGIIDDLTEIIRHHGTTIEVENLPVIHGNYIGISMILSHLIQNAIKFSESSPKKVTLRFKENKDHYILSIKDNGIGIDPQYSDKIFSLFQRLNTRDKYEGSGIGLAICKKVAHLHGGNISLESKPGEGSTFFVSLPK